MAGTITHEWNGTTLIITSDSGTSSCDLKGEKGDMGVRGAQGIQGDVQKGEKGDTGATGATGEKGDSLFFRYSPYADGSFMESAWHEGLDYMGVATAASAPEDNTKYSWSRIGKGVSAEDVEALVKAEIEKLNVEYGCWEEVTDLVSIPDGSYIDTQSATLNSGGKFRACFTGDPNNDVAMNVNIYENIHGGTVAEYSFTIPVSYLESGAPYITEWVEFELEASSYTIETYNANPTLCKEVLKTPIIAEKLGYDSYSVMSQKAVTESISECANAFKGSANGAVAIMKDCAPIEHSLEVAVSSDTIENLNTVTLNKAGGNLFKPYIATATANGITATLSPDGYIDISGSFETATNLTLAPTVPPGEPSIWTSKGKTIFPSGTYKGFGVNTDNVDINYQAYTETLDAKGNSSWLANIYCSGANTTSAPFYIQKIMVTVKNENGVNVKIPTIFSFADANITEFEPYKEIETIGVLTNGDLTSQIKSNYPTTILYTDTPEAVVSCTYNRDINKAFATLQSALLSLTGGVE